LFLSEAARVMKKHGKLALSDFVPQAANSGPIGRWLQNRLEPAYGRIEVAWPNGRYWKLGERWTPIFGQDRGVSKVESSDRFMPRGSGGSSLGSCPEMTRVRD